MKMLGIVLMIVGSIWGVAAFNMDTTVDTSRVDGSYNYIPGPRVHNIGKMDERRNHLLVAGLLVIVGAILLAIDALKRNAANPPIDRKPEPESDEPLPATVAKQSERQFPSSRSLESDEYQLYLVRNYKIEKNNTLEKYVVNGKLFSSVNDALHFAHTLDVASEMEQEAEERRVAEQLREAQRVAELELEDAKRSAQASAAGKASADNLANRTLAGLVVVVAVGIAVASFFGSRKSTDNQPEVSVEKPIVDAPKYTLDRLANAPAQIDVVCQYVGNLAALATSHKKERRSIDESVGQLRPMVEEKFGSEAYEKLKGQLTKKVHFARTYILEYGGEAYDTLEIRQMIQDVYAYKGVATKVPEVERDKCVAKLQTKLAARRGPNDGGQIVK